MENHYRIVMQENLHVTFIQSHLHWENITANLAMFEEKIALLPQKTDIIILPEMFSTGFTMNTSMLSEFMNQNTCKWLQKQAEKMQAVILASAIIKENNHFYNRLLWVEPSGNIDFYDKRHLFSFAGEDKAFTAGRKKIIKTWKGWHICPLICYDLRFPVWSRNVNLAYDLLIYIANWPNPRLRAWDILLQARAIENQAYCIGVNRAGTDGNGLSYNGNSAVYDFKGECLVKVENGEEKAVQIILDKSSLQEYRQKFTAYLDADAFEILEKKEQAQKK